MFRPLVVRMLIAAIVILNINMVSVRYCTALCLHIACIYIVETILQFLMCC